MSQCRALVVGLFTVALLALLILTAWAEGVHFRHLDLTVIGDRDNPNEADLYLQWGDLYAPVVYFHEDTIDYFPVALDFDRDHDYTPEEQRSNYDKLNAISDAPITFYVRIRKEGRVWVFEYWFYYVYDEKNTDMGLTRHAHDWERVFVRVDDRLGLMPESVTYYAHGESITVPFSRQIRENQYQCRVRVINDGHGSYPPDPSIRWPHPRGAYDLAVSAALGVPGGVDDGYMRADLRRKGMIALIERRDRSREINGVEHQAWDIIKQRTGGGIRREDAEIPDSLPGFGYPMPWRQAGW